MIPGHSVPLAGVGAMLILVGWVPYVAGFAAQSIHGAGHAAANVLLAAAAAGLAALLVARVRYGKPDVLLALLGLLGGLVSITAGAETVSTPGAVLTGAVAGLIVPTAAIVLDLFARIDDPAGTVAVHGVGGAWGVLAAGLFTPPGTAGNWLRLVGVQLLGLVAVAAWSGAISAGVWLALKATVGLRASEADEYDGLDLAEHDIGAYPDFQQTMIKSYHLREA
jgi:Amt family ammonium transporter